MKTFTIFLAALTIYSSFCTGCQASPTPMLHSMHPIMIPATSPDTGFSTDEDDLSFRFSERYAPVLEGYALARMNDVEKNWIAPVGHENNTALVEIAIDGSGKLLWITVVKPIDFDQAYIDALIRAIVKSAPFPRLPKGSPAQIILTAPFFGPKADSFGPQLVECKTKPNKPDWECSPDSSNKRKY